MTLDEYLTSLLNPLFANRVHWDVTPEGIVVTSPIAILQQIGGKEEWYIDKDLKKSHRHARIQITCWGRRRVEISEMSKTVSDTIRLDNAMVSEPYGAATSLYEETGKLYGFRQQFGLWFQES